LNIHGFNLGRIIEPNGTTYDGKDITGNLNSRTEQLHMLGVGPNSIVIICYGGSARFFQDLLAIWSLGACAVCLDERLSGFEIQNIVEFVKPIVILCRPGQHVNAGSFDVSCLEDRIPSALGNNYSSFYSGVLDAPALILFTSGTTGTPKGVVHTYRSLLSRIKLNHLMMGTELFSRTLCPLPTHFGHGLIGNCLTAWLSGGDLFLYPLTEITANIALPDYIDDNNISFMSSVPSMWKIITKVSKSPKGGSLKRINIGSAPLSADLWNSVIEWSDGANVSNMYGLTEAANWVAGISSHQVIPEDGLVGPMWGGQVGVVLPSGCISSVGEGELIIQTPSLMTGYFDQDELTKDVLKGGYFYTGDIGKVDRNGNIRLIGRRKFEINRAGVKISPEDLDNLFEQHISVREACAFGIPDDIAGELIGIAVSFDTSSIDIKSANFTELVDNLKLWVKQKLVTDKIPDRWYVLSEMPRTDRGKIDRIGITQRCISDLEAY